ncbi:MAG: M23 family metallopeptidase [Gemmatimonadaceae bacterium]
MKKYLVCLVAALALADLGSAQQVGRVPVDVSVGATPTALFALGRYQFVYELHITNFGDTPLVLERLETLDDKGVLLDAAFGPKLSQRIARVGAGPNPSATEIRLQPSSQVVAYLWISLQPGIQTPSKIQHRLIFGSLNEKRDTVNSAPSLVESQPLQILSPPVRGANWVAIRGPANSSGHRLSFVAIRGHAGIPQRYAVDWAMLGPDGRLFHGDSTKATNWYGYGVPVNAVASGTVVWANDGAPESAAFSVAAPKVIEQEAAVGNSIVIDLGNGRFATYAHLKPGSLRVKKGDKVTEGQAIAAVGNSGNTLGPHLHFHLNSAPEPLAGEGLPYVLRSFELVGRASSMGSMLNGTPWTANAAQPARSVTMETPLENMIVRFASPSASSDSVRRPN